MSSASRAEVPCWYVLNHIGGAFQNTAKKEFDRYSSANGNLLELFAPTYVVKEEREGEVRFRTANLTFHYVFVRGVLDNVKHLCAQTNGFSFLINHGSEERYAVIDDTSMVHFMNIARAYKNCLPYFSLEDIDLEDGDLVEVVRGDFPGLIGTFIPKARSKSGNIVLNIYNNVGTIAFDVRATDVRVLEFSRNSTRANDQIDAFVPNLLKAMRCFDRDEALPTALAAKLAVFCGRMEVVRLNNRKLDARLRILLYAANHIIGYTDKAAEALDKYRSLENSVTNEWTRGMKDIIQSVITKDKERLKGTYERLKSLEAGSKAQRMIMDEYEYYLSLSGDTGFNHV